MKVLTAYCDEDSGELSKVVLTRRFRAEDGLFRMDVLGDLLHACRGLYGDACQDWQEEWEGYGGGAPEADPLVSGRLQDGMDSCPKCGAFHSCVVNFSLGFAEANPELGSKQWVQCECGCSGPLCNSSEEAIRVWNERSAKARKEGKVRRNHPDISKSGEIRFLEE